MLQQKLKLKRILFFDSGVGGLSICQAVKKINPDVEPVYLFDNECFPYGEKSESFLIERVSDILDVAVKKFELSGIIVACNTASTVALPSLRNHISLPIIGVVPAIKPAALLSKKKIIALLATPGTINREYTDNLIKNYASDCRVIKIGSARLARIAEDRLTCGNVDETEVAGILSPIINLNKNERPDVIVLGCTHYPFVADVIKRILPDCLLVDSGAAIGKRVDSLFSGAKMLPVEVDKIEHRAFYLGKLKNYADRFEMFKHFGFTSLDEFSLKEIV
ncbi:MAG: glutamate racemase [Succinatimonas sp.]|nr:glutamate racemase [Succinatimonas sp.]